MMLIVQRTSNSDNLEETGSNYAKSIPTGFHENVPLFYGSLDPMQRCEFQKWAYQLLDKLG